MTISVTAVTNSLTTVYTSTNNTAITYLNLTNSSGGTLTVDIHVIPSGGTAGTTNLVAKTLSINNTDSYQLYSGGEKLLLANGDFVQIISSGATGINAVTSFTAI
jgi:hypothetical protein